VLSILLIVLIIAVVLFLLAALSGLVVWAASGMGWVLINWLHVPFTPFEATLLSLITFVAVAWSAWRVLVNVISFPLGTNPTEDEDEDEDWDEEEDDYEEEQEQEETQPIPSIPKWRQPIRRASDGLPVVDPDDRCPCGSGRKYKNCHGRKSRT
jgi:hypothetical protein